MNPDLARGDGARILTLNRGSATLKASLYQAGPQEKMVLSIKIDRADSSGGHVTITGTDGKSLLDTEVEPGDPDAALNAVFDWLEKQRYLADLAAAAHDSRSRGG